MVVVGNQAKTGRRNRNGHLEFECAGARQEELQDPGCLLESQGDNGNETKTVYP